MNKARVGIIVDNLNSSKQIYDYIKMSFNSKNYKVTHLIVQNTTDTKKNILAKSLSYIKKKGLGRFLSIIFFKVLFGIESLFFRRDKKLKNFFKTYSLKEFDLETIYVEPIISNNGFIHNYSKRDLEKIKSKDFNLLIRGGTGILKGEILNICKNGIISFHHGDNQFYRGGPPGFWEIRNKEIRTGFIIQKLNDELDNGEILFKGFFSTHWIYTLNLINLLEKSNLFLHHVIEDLTSNSPQMILRDKYLSPPKIYTLPSIFIQLSYVGTLIKNIITKFLDKYFKKDYRWNIAYQYTKKWKNINLNQLNIIPNPPNRYLADPFLIKKGENHYCFVEDYNIKTNKGSISVYEITKNSYKEMGIALEESFHLSYPFIFKYKNDIYMCPETTEAKDIRLYKCIDFPLKWEFTQTLIHNVIAADTNIFYKDKKWWLMTNLSNSQIQDNQSELHIFSNENLFSDQWKPHNKNPVIFDPLFARNAGFVIENTNYYRVFQRPGFNHYGKSLGVSKINEINQNIYKEKYEFEVLPDFLRDIKGTHTYNFSEGLLILDFLKTSKKIKA